MCEKQKNLSEKLQLGMYTEEPLLRWLKISCGWLLLNNLLDWTSMQNVSVVPDFNDSRKYGADGKN
jgi:hypothetical protein